jgi:hypothetical protein
MTEHLYVIIVTGDKVISKTDELPTFMGDTTTNKNKRSEHDSGLGENKSEHSRVGHYATLDRV